MKKVIILSMIAILMTITPDVNAQVKIGAGEPTPGTVLDLSSTAIGGLLLPNLTLDTQWDIPASWNTTAAELPVGLMIYNLDGGSLEPGVYVWMNETDGWLPASSEKIVTISFDTNGGDNALPDTKALVGFNYPALPDAIKTDTQTPVTHSYKFLGWFTEADGGNQITADSIVTNEKSLTLYAHWKDTPLDLTSNKDLVRNAFNVISHLLEDFRDGDFVKELHTYARINDKKPNNGEGSSGNGEDSGNGGSGNENQQSGSTDFAEKVGKVFEPFWFELLEDIDHDGTYVDGTTIQNCTITSPVSKNNLADKRYKINYDEHIWQYRDLCNTRKDNFTVAKDVFGEETLAWKDAVYEFKPEYYFREFIGELLPEYLSKEGEDLPLIGRLKSEYLINGYTVPNTMNFVKIPAMTAKGANKQRGLASWARTENPGSNEVKLQFPSAAELDRFSKALDKAFEARLTSIIEPLKSIDPGNVPGAVGILSGVLGPLNKFYTDIANGSFVQGIVKDADDNDVATIIPENTRQLSVGDYTDEYIKLYQATAASEKHEFWGPKEGVATYKIFGANGDPDTVIAQINIVDVLYDGNGFPKKGVASLYANPVHGDIVFERERATRLRADLTLKSDIRPDEELFASLTLHLANGSVFILSIPDYFGDLFGGETERTSRLVNEVDLKVVQGELTVEGSADWAAIRSLDLDHNLWAVADVSTVNEYTELYVYRNGIKIGKLFGKNEHPEYVWIRWLNPDGTMLEEEKTSIYWSDLRDLAINVFYQL
ncbi:hypothetical protein FACS189413_06290 [Bacteroidia bacterium]|nr:hypothetical protein FACS189413_06290 [Bacteroidia bacterium]